MTRSEILDKLKDIFRMMGKLTPEAIDACGEGSSLTTDLGLTSIGVLYTVIAIEEFFRIHFDNVSFADFETVGSVVDYIERELNQ